MPRFTLLIQRRAKPGMACRQAGDSPSGGSLLFSRLAIYAAAAVLLPPALAAEPTCTVVDLMPQFWKVVGASRDQSPEQQIETFRATLVDRHPGLFGKTGLGFDSTEQLEAAILKSLADTLRDEASMRAVVDLLKTGLASHLQTFQAVFPDFRCDFVVYITPSLNQLDGAGRVVDDQPALIFGADVMPKSTPLPISESLSITSSSTVTTARSPVSATTRVSRR